MAGFSFKSAGHFLATFFEAFKHEIEKVANSETTVEAVTGAIPVYGPAAVQVEKAAYAILGEVGALLAAGGAAAKAKLADAGLDIAVIATVENVVTSVPQAVAVIKAATKKAA